MVCTVCTEPQCLYKGVPYFYIYHRFSGIWCLHFQCWSRSQRGTEKMSSCNNNQLDAFFFIWRDSPQWAMASSVTRFPDNTQRRTTVGRTPLDERSARRRDHYLTTQNIHIHAPGWDSNPQSQLANGLRPMH